MNRAAAFSPLAASVSVACASVVAVTSWVLPVVVAVMVITSFGVIRPFGEPCTSGAAENSRCARGKVKTGARVLDSDIAPKSFCYPYTRKGRISQVAEGQGVLKGHHSYR